MNSWLNFWFLNPLKFLSCTHTLHVLAIIWFIFIILANIFPITCTVNKRPKGYTLITYYHYTIHFLKMSSNLHYTSEVIPIFIVSTDTLFDFEAKICIYCTRYARGIWMTEWFQHLDHWNSVLNQRHKYLCLRLN